MPRVSQAHFDTRRREILLAAHRCFATHGFRAATMQQVADEAGLSVGAIYRYFDGKEVLIEALAEWGRAQKREAMEAAESGAGVGGLRAFVARMIDYLPAALDEDQAVRFDVRIWGEALGERRLERLVTANLKALRETLADYVGEERAAGRIREDTDPESVARALVSLLAGLELQLAFDPRLDRDAYTDAVRCLLGALEP